MGDRSEAVHACCCLGCQRFPRGRTADRHRAINRILVTLTERGRRLFAGLLALERGHGGIIELATITGLSRTTIRRGILEIRRTDPEITDRVRRPGGGRKRLEKKVPG